MTGPDGRRDEAGYATVWSVIWMGGLLAATGLVLFVVGGVARQHHLDGSADLVAVSAATALNEGSDACLTASRIAAANHVLLGSCRVDQRDVIVLVTDRLDLPLELHLELAGRARAGPSSQ